jgi:hypothetical protein
MKSDLLSFIRKAKQFLSSSSASPAQVEKAEEFFLH